MTVSEVRDYIYNRKISVGSDYEELYTEVDLLTLTKERWPDTKRRTFRKIASNIDFKLMKLPELEQYCRELEVSAGFSRSLQMFAPLRDSIARGWNYGIDDLVKSLKGLRGKNENNVIVCSPYLRKAVTDKIPEGKVSKLIVTSFITYEAAYAAGETIVSKSSPKNMWDDGLLLLDRSDFKYISANFYPRFDFAADGLRIYDKYLFTHGN